MHSPNEGRIEGEKEKFDPDLLATTTFFLREPADLSGISHAVGGRSHSDQELPDDRNNQGIPTETIN